MAETKPLPVTPPTSTPAYQDEKPEDKAKLKPIPKTTKVSDILKGNSNNHEQLEKKAVKILTDEPFTPEQLRATWLEFAEQRKIYQAEYQLLSRPYELRDGKVIVELLHPVQETMLNNLKIEITTYLREKLGNNSIIVSGEVKVTEDKKIIYTNREKFEYLAEKNPLLNELKDRLGLDTDF